MKKSPFKVGRDNQGRNCIHIGPIGSKIGYISIPEKGSIDVEITTEQSWNNRFKVLAKYSVKQACELFLNYGVILGASDEVVDALSKVITITTEDREKMTAKFRNPPPTEMVKKKTATKKKSPVKKSSPPSKKTPSKNSKSTAKVKKSQSSGRSTKAKAVSSENYKSAAAMFQGLIMEGKLTDDEIFALVKEKFGLDDKKKSYVNWYRNKLKKDGKNPPEAK